MIKAINFQDGSIRNIQVMSVRLPSMLGLMADEIEQVVRHFAENVRHQMRNKIFIGMDATFTLSERHATAGVVGTAIPQQHTPTAATRKTMTELIQLMFLLSCGQ